MDYNGLVLIVGPAARVEYTLKKKSCESLVHEQTYRNSGDMNIPMLKLNSEVRVMSAQLDSTERGVSFSFVE